MLEYATQLNERESSAKSVLQKYSLLDSALPIPKWPRHAPEQWMWLNYCELRHAQEMLFSDSLLQLRFDFGDGPQ